jgi:hypothetical protein
MSAIKLAPQPQLLPRLRAITRVSSPRLRIGITLVIGIVSIVLTQLVLSILTDQGAYDMARLKAERHELTTSSDILSAQVGSLASNQNLANSAQSLGMIPNSSPVFLRLADGSLIGKPKAAYFDSRHQVSRNLVPNAAMTTRSRWATTASIATPNASNAQAASAQVTLTSGDLPVSPTN